MSSCCLVDPGATLHTSGGAPSCQVAQEEQQDCKVEFEVTDYTCPVLSTENTISVHVTVETTRNIAEIPNVQELVI